MRYGGFFLFCHFTSYNSFLFWLGEGWVFQRGGEFEEKYKKKAKSINIDWHTWLKVSVFHGNFIACFCFAATETFVDGFFGPLECLKFAIFSGLILGFHINEKKRGKLNPCDIIIRFFFSSLLLLCTNANPLGRERDGDTFSSSSSSWAPHARWSHAVCKLIDNLKQNPSSWNGNEFSSPSTQAFHEFFLFSVLHLRARERKEKMGKHFQYLPSFMTRQTVFPVLSVFIYWDVAKRNVTSGWVLRTWLFWDFKKLVWPEV